MIDVELEQPRDAWSDLAALDEQLLTLEAARSGKRRDFSPYIGRPLDWITDVLKVRTLWSKQQEMIDALETHDRVVFYGGVNLGKDYRDRKSTRLNSSHSQISYAVFCLEKKN